MVASAYNDPVDLVYLRPRRPALYADYHVPEETIYQVSDYDLHMSSPQFHALCDSKSTPPMYVLPNAIS